MQAFLGAYEHLQTIIEDKWLAALQTNPTLSKLKSNKEEKIKKFESK